MPPPREEEGEVERSYVAAVAVCHVALFLRRAPSGTGDTRGSAGEVPVTVASYCTYASTHSNRNRLQYICVSRSQGIQSSEGLL